MARMGAKHGPTLAAKESVVNSIAQGMSVEEACRLANRAVKTYEEWRRVDKDFAGRIDTVRARLKAQADADGVKAPGRRDISFEEFRLEYLGRETYPHQRAWIQALEKGEVDDDLPGTFERRNPNRLMVNVPPGHSKSTVMTVEYPVYRLCMNPETSIVIVGKTQEKAKKFLYAIKQRLTDPRWGKLQAAFAPEGGFKKKGAEWSATKIYLGADVTSEEKDPSVMALGIRGDLQGSRVQLMILDDAVDTLNSHLWEDQKQWLDDIVQSRLYNGKLLLIGTRASSKDLYAALLNGENYISGNTPWSRLKQPAVLQYADDVNEWVTLWGRSTQPYDPDDTTSTPDEDGLYPAFDGAKLAGIRAAISADRWAFLYQQEDSSSDSVFQKECVYGSEVKRRKAGPLRVGGALLHGAEGMYTIGGLDPAMAGITAITILKVDTVNGKMYVENVFTKKAPNPSYFTDAILQYTAEYGVNEWVIEANAFQSYLAYDENLIHELAIRGVRLTPHVTGRNKRDQDFGVASMASLFGSMRINASGQRTFNGDNTLELPDRTSAPGVAVLMEELISWMPGKDGKQLLQDTVMSLWFAVIKARESLGFGRTNQREVTTHVQSRYTSRRSERRRAIIPATALV
jgi:hypothetical protein